MYFIYSLYLYFRIFLSVRSFKNKARRKEELETPFLEFMENTGLRKISITKLEKELDLTFDTQTSFNKEEFDCIKKWFMSCKKARTCNGYFGKVPDGLVRCNN